MTHLLINSFMGAPQDLSKRFVEGCAKEWRLWRCVQHHWIVQCKLAISPQNWHITRMAKSKSYSCSDCGAVTNKWSGRWLRWWDRAPCIADTPSCASGSRKPPIAASSASRTLQTGTSLSWAIRPAGALSTTTAIATYAQTVADRKSMTVFAAGYNGALTPRAPRVSLLYNR